MRVFITAFSRALLEVDETSLHPIQAFLALDQELSCERSFVRRISPLAHPAHGVCRNRKDGT